MVSRQLRRGGYVRFQAIQSTWGGARPGGRIRVETESIFESQVSENFLNNRRVFNAGDHLDCAAAMGTGFDIDVEQLS